MAGLDSADYGRGFGCGESLDRFGTNGHLAGCASSRALWAHLKTGAFIMRTGLGLRALVLTVQRVHLTLGVELGVYAAHDRGGEQLVAGAELGEVTAPLITTATTTVTTGSVATHLLRDNAGELRNVAIKIANLSLDPRRLIQKETVRVNRGHSALLERLTIHRKRSTAATTLFTATITAALLRAATLLRATTTRLLGPSTTGLLAYHST